MVYSAKWSFLFYDFFFFKIQKDLQFTPIKCSPAQHRLSSRKFPQKLEESTDQEMSSVNKFLVKKKRRMRIYSFPRKKNNFFWLLVLILNWPVLDRKSERHRTLHHFMYYTRIPCTSRRQWTPTSSNSRSSKNRQINPITLESADGKEFI